MTKWIKKLAASAAIAGALASGAVMASDTANADIYSNRAQLVCDRHGLQPDVQQPSTPSTNIRVSASASSPVLSPTACVTTAPSITTSPRHGWQSL